MTFDFITSDLHEMHAAMIENHWRPFTTVQEMHEQLTANWNSVVKPADRVLVVGDAAMAHRAESLPLLDDLNGHKSLVPGNHDHVHPMHPKHRERWMSAHLEHFEEILPVQITLTIAGMDVNVCHFPFNADHTEEVRFPEWRPVDDGRWLLHGHIHGKTPISPDRPRQIDVGMDAWDFTPVSIDTIANIIKGDAQA